ncbi:hypothetical protein AWC38_SpisGene9510 [Stylophora pistillata]|uniref:Uncharacterized protein n=1 Tax=Stylophora pistillata TaxID=50429 RepID=A0A2B4S554_STYPI|nr:hypothetical protein AWC38_SpisGene9510 [Stylophora pistillata]
MLWRAPVLQAAVRTKVLVKAALLTKVTAVCALLDSKVKTVLKTLTSVLLEKILVVPMLCVPIPRDLTSVHANLDTLEMDIAALNLQRAKKFTTVIYFGCGDGGWTSVMKINGNKSTFHYSSNFWKSKTAYDPDGGKTGFDLRETKLPTYWRTPFSKICLGMKINQQIRFIVVKQQADSLYSLIADGKYRNTTLGRDKWKTLIGSQASLQLSCNKEGFNAVGKKRRFSRARIGIIANQQDDCFTCNSRVGFGTGGHNDDSKTCGNEATRSPENGEKHIKIMGYILVQ